jgi:prevent-host-death family protein
MTTPLYNDHIIQVTATEYRHNALRLLEQVRVWGETVQITKRGRPIAQLVRCDDVKLAREFGKFRDDATVVGDIVGPMLDPDEWDSVALF